MVTQRKLIKFIELAVQTANLLPRYNSKFSNRIFDNRQKMAIVILKQKLKTTYRGVLEILEISEIARARFKLNRLPDHSTLVKFLQRISSSLIDSLLMEKEAEIIAVDSTGFETECMSYYYRTIHNAVRSRRHYAKLSLAVDAEKQKILAQKIRLGPRNDNIDFKTLLKNLSAKFVVADKGYDSRKNRYFVLRKMKAYPQIPYRKTSGATYIKGKTKVKIDDKIYHQRSKIETIFSAIKRKYGSIIRSRKFDTQKKEIICRLVAYNIDREVILSVYMIMISPKPKNGACLINKFVY